MPQSRRAGRQDSDCAASNGPYTISMLSLIELGNNTYLLDEKSESAASGVNGFSGSTLFSLENYAPQCSLE
jgi:hypothetical protein